MYKSRTSLFVGSHFVFLHVHSTFHRKVGLNHVGVEGGRARENADLQKPVK